MSSQGRGHEVYVEEWLDSMSEPWRRHAQMQAGEPLKLCSPIALAYRAVAISLTSAGTRQQHGIRRRLFRKNQVVVVGQL